MDDHWFVDAKVSPSVGQHLVALGRSFEVDDLALGVDRGLGI